MKPEILLKAYVVHESDDAFRELVAASLDEVYSTALRIVDGASHLAEETALRVYRELARKPPKLGEDLVLASWLRERTCKTAVIVLREECRSANRLALKSEKHAISTPNSLQAAPRGLATRVCQSVLLNVARNKSFGRLLWPAWIRFTHIGAAAICVLVIVVLWKVPFRRSHRMVQSGGVQLTPASFAQLGSSSDGDVPSSSSVGAETNSKTNAKQ